MGEQLHSGAVTFIMMIFYTRILFSRSYVASSFHVHTSHPLSTSIRRILFPHLYVAFSFHVHTPHLYILYPTPPFPDNLLLYVFTCHN